ncbi:MAG: hypothetical protein D8M58_10810 [Calditrichaeota bacterium]|nr:MAG: hypothetical protein DWQ03_10185 [Calditrichota bacterium]MBL1205882.1 hypothetical protein [Calditrichota bacterium]NOG45710.1 hypothetical protein [Calditrichota bacterium]
MTLKLEEQARLEKKLPGYLPIEQMRQWLIDQINSIDKDRRSIKERLAAAEKDQSGRFIKDGDVRAKTKNHYLKMERLFYRNKLGEINQKIKERNVAKHSIGKNEVHIFIEMAKLLEERDYVLYDEIRDQAEINLNIRKRKTSSSYVKMMKDNGNG